MFHKKSTLTASENSRTLDAIGRDTYVASYTRAYHLNRRQEAVLPGRLGLLASGAGAAILGIGYGLTEGNLDTMFLAGDTAVIAAGAATYLGSLGTRLVHGVRANIESRRVDRLMDEAHQSSAVSLVQQQALEASYLQPTETTRRAA